MADIPKLRRASALFMAAVFVVAFIGWGVGQINEKKESKKEAEQQQAQKQVEDNKKYVEGLLSKVKSNMPEKLSVGAEPSDISFSDALDNKIDLKDYSGKIVVLTYWNSWGEDSLKQMAKNTELQSVVKQMSNVEYFLVNKLDQENETKETAQTYISDNNITGNIVYDDNLNVFNKYGLKTVPTTIVFDGEGKVALCYGGVIETKDDFSAILNYVLQK